eukprot:scpid85400/ scgid29786/ Disintegrin and metalloproteinase domain-containing protein 28; Epididymial metalloproteinase-like, disintegrin-like, and cysteine-rich protein II
MHSRGRMPSAMSLDSMVLVCLSALALVGGLSATRHVNPSRPRSEDEPLPLESVRWLQYATDGRFELVDIPESAYRPGRAADQRSSEALSRLLSPRGDEAASAAADRDVLLIPIGSGTPRTFHLKLRPNVQLLPPGHLALVHSDRGGEVRIGKRSKDDCYYQGEVGNYVTSQAVVSTCHGVVGEFSFTETATLARENYGAIGGSSAGGRSASHCFIIEPLTHRPLANGSHFHALLRCEHVAARQAEKPRGQLPAAPPRRDQSHDYVHLLPDRHGDVETSPRRLSRSADDDVEKVTIELVLCLDSSLLHKLSREPYDADDDHTKNTVGVPLARARQIANRVDALFAKLGVRVALVMVDAWTNGDRIQVSSQLRSTLDDFLVYRKYQLVPIVKHDVAVLLSAVRFAENVVGMAYPSSICSRCRSGAVVHDDGRRGLAGVVASTVAHEIGHTLGLRHDEDDEKGNATCVCPATGAADNSTLCIMAGVTPVNSIQCSWSNCSRRRLDNFLGDGAASDCLHNLPRRSPGDAVCGNTVVEDGEQCDCGVPELCGDACCVAADCRLRDGAQCNSGDCCRNC